MSSVRPKCWSIQRRLLLLYTAAAGALLIAFSITLYGAILHYMDGRATAHLESRIIDARGDLDDDDGLDDLNAKLADLDPAEVTEWIRVLSTNGRVLAETPGMQARAPRAAFPASIQGKATRTDLHDTGGHWVSLASAQVFENHRNQIVQLAEDRGADLDFLRKLRWMLAALSVAGIMVSSIIAGIVTRRGLDPLKAMEAATARVRVPLDNERLGSRPWPSEVAPLARAFDEMMDRLQDSFTRLSQFSADLAHELRTPIANLRGEAEVALTRARSAEEYRQVLESAMEEYTRLGAMTEKMLFLARADAQEAEVNLEEVDGRATIDSLWEYYESYAEERGVMLKARGSGTLQADAVLLRRAVANLIENALRFTPAGNEVLVEVTGGAIRVRDTGVGIASDHLPRIFDRFYQVDPSRRAEGIGLGLALVKSIMKMHSGTVTITSRQGTGTEATLRFPLAHSSKQTATEMSEN